MTDFQKFMLLALGFFPVTFLCGQEPFEVRWSGPNKMQRNDHRHTVVHADTGSIYCLGFHAKKKDVFDTGVPVLDRFNWELQRENSDILAGFNRTDSISYRGLLNILGYTYLFYDKELEHLQHIFMVRRVNLKENRLEGDPIPIGDTLRILKHTLAISPFFGSSIFGYQSLASAYIINGDKVAFIFYKNLQNFTVAVYNRKMKPLWQKKCALPFDDRGTTLMDFTLTRTGEVIMEFRQYDKMLMNYWDERLQSDPFKPFLVQISGQSSDANIYQLDVGKAYYGRLVGNEDENGQLFFVSTYSDKEFNRSYGLVEYVIDPITRKMTIHGPTPFSPELVAAIAPADSEKQPNSLQHFNLTWINKTAEAEVLGEFHSEEGTGALGNLALIQLDSAFRQMRGVSIVKSQIINPYDNQKEYLYETILRTNAGNFLFYNKNLSKNTTHFFTTFCDVNGEKQSYPIAPPADHSALFLSGSHIMYKNRYLMLAESELHDQYYLGVFEIK